jgi:hypothetical protein
VGCALLALALPACAEDDSTAARERPAAGGPDALYGSGAVKGVNEDAVRRCRGQLGGFLAALDGLRDAVAVGVTYEAYLDRVQRLRRSYDELPVARLAIGCLTRVGTPAESALGRHVDAANLWSGCVGDAGCATESVEPGLQHRWALASRLLSRAQAGLREIRSHQG